MPIWLLNIYIIDSTFPGKFSYLLFSLMHCCPWIPTFLSVATDCITSLDPENYSIEHSSSLCAWYWSNNCYNLSLLAQILTVVCMSVSRSDDACDDPSLHVQSGGGRQDHCSPLQRCHCPGLFQRRVHPAVCSRAHQDCLPTPTRVSHIPCPCILYIPCGNFGKVWNSHLKHMQYLQWSCDHNIVQWAPELILWKVGRDCRLQLTGFAHSKVMNVIVGQLARSRAFECECSSGRGDQLWGVVL